MFLRSSEDLRILKAEIDVLSEAETDGALDEVSSSFTPSSSPVILSFNLEFALLLLTLGVLGQRVSIRVQRFELESYLDVQDFLWLFQGASEYL